jgi:hypothetical protein
VGCFICQIEKFMGHVLVARLRFQLWICYHIPSLSCTLPLCAALVHLFNT